MLFAEILHELVFAGCVAPDGTDDFHLICTV